MTTLTATQKKRLEKLAAAAGKTPSVMLAFVLRDGFDYCEHVVTKAREGLAQRQTGKTVSGDSILQQGRAIIEKHAARHKAAA